METNQIIHLPVMLLSVFSKISRYLAGDFVCLYIVPVLRLSNIHPLFLVLKWAIVSIIKIIVKTRMLATIPVSIRQNIPGTHSLIRGLKHKKLGFLCSHILAMHLLILL